MAQTGSPGNERLLELLEYELALRDAEQNLIRFSQMTMPDNRKPEDPHRSKYLAAKHNEFMAGIFEAVERGEVQKVIINVPPRHGKSQLLTINGTAWYAGRNPDQDVICATYNETFARDFGAKVRDVMESPRYKQIFPDFFLTTSKTDQLTTYAGGDLFFLGRRSSTTGRGANLINVDDPTKDDREVRYDTFREDCWQWFTQTLLTRRHDDKAAIIVTQCMVGSTPVLMSDGTEKPLVDVKPGDQVATYEDGRLSTATAVRLVNNGPDKVFTIRMKSGAFVTANARHPFLAENKGKLEWRRTDTLRPGQNILRVTTGNGRESLVQRMAATSQPSARGSVTPTTKDFTPDEIVSIVPAGIEDVFDITVERTENFIANGLVSHNTRWHEDDIVGRLTDKNNPAYSERLAEGFEIINLPAFALDDDPLGRVAGEPLWPERFGAKYLEEMRSANSTAFSALYQSDPTPEDGVFYSKGDIYTYEPSELPTNLRVYVVSDHAVSTAQQNDPTVIIPFGIDEDGTAWVLPHITWRKMKSDETVNDMVEIIRDKSPIFWYAEKGHISKALGPFLAKRMEEEGVHCPIIEEQPVGDKLQRAQSARARCAQGKIKFPAFAPWWGKAQAELLKFPNGRHDDFVDCVSMIGNKINWNNNAQHAKQEKKYDRGTFGYLVKQWQRDDAQQSFTERSASW